MTTVSTIVGITIGAKSLRSRLMDEKFMTVSKIGDHDSQAVE